MVVVTPVSICDVVRAECLMCTVYIEFHTLLHTLLLPFMSTKKKKYSESHDQFMYFRVNQVYIAESILTGYVLFVCNHHFSRPFVDSIMTLNYMHFLLFHSSLKA